MAGRALNNKQQLAFAIVIGVSTNNPAGNVQSEK